MWNRVPSMAAAAVLIIAVGIGWYAISTTPTPTLTTTPTPTLERPPPTGGTPQAEILDSNLYIDYRGDVRIVGEVQNTGDVPLQSIYVASDLKDENGTVLDSSWTAAVLRVLAPGEKSPFQIVHLERGLQPADFTVRIADYAISSALPYRDYRISDVKAYVDEDEGIYKVVGKVANTGKRDTDETIVVGTFYNAEGRVIASTFYFTDSPFLRSGKTASFTLRVLTSAEPIENIANYNLSVQGEVE